MFFVDRLPFFEGDVDLDARVVEAHRFRLRDEIFGEVFASDEIEDRSLEIGVRENRRRGDFLAREGRDGLRRAPDFGRIHRQPARRDLHARDATVFDENLLHRGVEGDIDAVFDEFVAKHFDEEVSAPLEGEDAFGHEVGKDNAVG